MSEKNYTPPDVPKEEAAAAQPQPPVNASNEPPRRRVGTITMALSLIAVGVLMILRLFLPGLNASLIAQFSPLVLVFLGVEILVTNKRVKNGEFRYDGLSIVIVILLIGGSLATVVGSEWIRWESERSGIQRRLENQLLDDGFAALRSAGFENAELQWYINLNYSRNFDTEASLAEISKDNPIWVDVNLNKEYSDPERFSKDAAKLVQTLLPVCEDMQGLTINSLNPPYSGLYEPGDQRYTVTITSPRRQGDSLAVIEKNLSVELWQGDYFVSQYEYYEQQRIDQEDRMIAQQDGYGETEVWIADPLMVEEKPEEPEAIEEPEESVDEEEGETKKSSGASGKAA